MTEAVDDGPGSLDGAGSAEGAGSADGVSVIEADPRRPGRVAVWVALPVAVVLGLLVAVMATSESARERTAGSELIGELAPAVRGTTIDGATFDLDAERGRWVVVNFFATWCIPCRVEHPELVAFQQEHAVVGDATIVSVVFDDSVESVRAFFADNGGDWPVVLDEDGSISIRYGVTGVPESYLVAPSGIVVAKLVGGVERADLDAAIARATGAS
ncbi:MAG: TlpA family protein disulfide reductase [Actinomyces sp.]|nr:MAG: TlpA family protein disulfide reductase [Actinomyces sp.]